MSEGNESFWFDGWAVIELLGHRKRAGKVRTADLGGTAVFVVSTPADDQPSGFVDEIYAAGALYALTPCTEDVARLAAWSINPAPINRYDLPDHVREAMAELERRKRDEARAIEAEGNETCQAALRFSWSLVSGDPLAIGPTEDHDDDADDRDS